MDLWKWVYEEPYLINQIPASWSKAIANADKLGAAYEKGLDVATDWGEDDELPSVVTKQQKTNWDIGVYIS